MKLIFSTARLTVQEVFSNVDGADRDVLFNRVAEILSPAVVQYLPAVFQNVNTRQDAERWFTQMTEESRLFVVKEKESENLVGLLFVFVAAEKMAHIGYLLAEEYWGRGIAVELLRGFIKFARQQDEWVGLVAGVEKDNRASAALLGNLGFAVSPGSDGGVTQYSYDLRLTDRL